MEYRMYCLVLRQLSPIQKGVQSAHVCLEYANKYGDTKEYQDYFNNDKTLIMLDGGTAPELEEIMAYLETTKINVSCFLEPDLNNCITAICFLANERVWDKKKYPEKEEWVRNAVNINVNPCEYDDCWLEIVMDNDRESLILRDLIKTKKLSL